MSCCDGRAFAAQEWKRLAEALHKARDHYEAFLVIHGTDTMAYTAAALSLMLVRPPCAGAASCCASMWPPIGAHVMPHAAWLRALMSIAVASHPRPPLRSLPCPF